MGLESTKGQWWALARGTQERQDMVCMGGGQSPGKAGLPAGGTSSSPSPGKLFMKAMPLGWEGRCQDSLSFSRKIRGQEFPVPLYNQDHQACVCVCVGGCLPVILPP